jgi:hypothetical protein
MSMNCSVEDRAEIEALLARYCFALDTKNFDDLRNVMTDDVVFDYTDEFGEPHQGVETVINLVRAALTPHPASIHAALTTHVTSTGADTASGSTHAISVSVVDGERVPGKTDTTFVVFCTWLDDYLRTSEGWRLKRRKLKVVSSLGDSSKWDPQTLAGQAFRRVTGER